MAERRPNWMMRRWRTLLSTAGGLVTGVGISLAGRPPGFASLAGWDVGCLVFLATTFWIMARDDESKIRARAADEDEGQPVMMTMIAFAVLASLGAAVVALREGRSGALPVALSVCTLMLGWFVLQTVFALRYAHRYFADNDRDGSIDQGLKFPGDPPRRYMDFVYMSVCVGATAQVSDISVTGARFRGLVTQHALLAFFYNTLVLAFGINILGSAIGH